MRAYPKSFGAIATPPGIAKYLVDWAIRSHNDTVLDLGAGEGVFLTEAFRSLSDLGAKAVDALEQLYGVERREEIYREAVRYLTQELGGAPSGLLLANLFDTELPFVDAVIGNPPYVRRNSLTEVDAIRDRLTRINLLLGNLDRLTDLYTYFIMYASHFLKPKGRLALVVSSSWLDVHYGADLKRFLMSEFSIRGVVMFEGRVFKDALVKSVLLLAEKKPTAGDGLVRFIRVSNGPSAIPLAENLLAMTTNGDFGNIKVSAIPGEDLDPYSPWGVYLKMPEALVAVLRESAFTNLGKMVESRIGLQTLAGDFYILSRRQLQQAGLPPEYVQPLAFGPREVSSKVLESEGDVRHYVLYVKRLDGDTPDTVRSYVEDAERRPVTLRGKDEVVTGYQNSPRIQQARRTPWYNLVTEIERRGRYPILLPRRCYGSFIVVWNKSNEVPNENFIELRPRDTNLLLPLLAVLNSSLFEVAVRGYSQLYGGGVYNLNPANVRDLRLPAVNKLSRTALERLQRAYLEFCEETSIQARRRLDESVMSAFDLETKSSLVEQTLVDLRSLSRRAKGNVA